MEEKESKMIEFSEQRAYTYLTLTRRATKMDKEYNKRKKTHREETKVLRAIGRFSDRASIALFSNRFYLPVCWLL